MPHDVITTAEVRRLFSHPAWTPEDEDGAVINGVLTVTVGGTNSGYTDLPTLTIDHGDGRGVILEVVEGSVSGSIGVNIIHPGSGYDTAAPPTVAVVGTGGPATVTLTAGALGAGVTQEFDNVEGSMFKIGGESGFEEDFEDRTGDGDSGEINGPTKFRRSFDRTLSWVSPATLNRWVQKYLQTVADDPTRRVASMVERFGASGDSNTTEFYVQKLVDTVEAKGVVMGASNARIRKPVTQERV